MPNKVVAVDYNDAKIKVLDKMEAHLKPILHRAFSVFLYNGNKVLLQKRAKNKYHSGGLIANTCCSHPQSNENIIANAKQRLIEELDIHVESLSEIGTFIYYNKFNDNLYEYEYDHILVGEFNGSYNLNLEEVSWLGWVEIDDIKRDIVENPNKYAVWFVTAFDIFLKFFYNK
ncbi:MAG: NUDIX domain-containing protein [Clostridia bacterium]|nr:NUDIX domain-containing protein [Clostridia bacterium]